MNQIFITLVLSFVFSCCATAQQGWDKTERKEVEKDADFYFESENYLTALPLYKQLMDADAANIGYKMRCGICYLYKTDEKEKAIQLLEEVLAESPKEEDLYFYLGRAYHINSRFDEAIEQFNLAKQKKTSKKNKQLIGLYVDYCNNAKELMDEPVNVTIENIGPPVNTSDNEYAPVISSDESVLIYTYRGPKSKGGVLDKFGRQAEKGSYYEDIFITYKVGNIWLDPESIGDNINTTAHDAAVALSPDGQKLFIYRDTYEEASGELFVSELDSNLWTTPVRLGEHINSKQWDCSATLSPDGKTLYFSSTREGTLGGRDIWRSRLTDEGEWGAAENLGPVINTPYDDDAAFIHPDGKTLYFSSKGHKSMGGYDIFKATLQEDDSSFSEPVNIGYPINTPDDDIYFVLAANGKRGYYSSAKAGGYGQQDIYVVRFDVPAMPQSLVMLKGEVTANDKAAEALISVTYADDESLQGTYKSNSASGNYLINLPPGHIYTITYQVEGFPFEVKRLDARGVTGYKEEIINVRLYSADYMPRLTILGNLTYGKINMLPASDIKLMIAAADGTWKEYKNTRTDVKGAFRFVNLPPDKNYIICLDKENILLSADEITKIEGIALFGGEPKAGLYVNDVSTNTDGSFVIRNVCPDGFQFKKTDTAELLKSYGDKSAEGLSFRVQIAAYYAPENYVYSHLSDLGKVERITLDDMITRFTIGGAFSTFNEANEMLEKVIERGQSDAFITGIYQGKRMLLSRLIEMGVFSR